MSPDDVAYSGRMLDLAASAPADRTARDALLWVLNKPYRADFGAFGDQFAGAAALLVRHHGDDPEAVRIGLELDNVLSVRRDALLMGLMASAKNREAKGLARLGLAQYLQKKALAAAAVRKFPGRPKNRFRAIGDDGKLYDKEAEAPDEDYAYHLLLRQCDADFLRAEAERLYEEVIADYADLPFITVKRRELEALLASPQLRTGASRWLARIEVGSRQTSRERGRSAKLPRPDSTRSTTSSWASRRRRSAEWTSTASR